VSKRPDTEDRFEILGELGEGGTGKVFRVMDRVRGEEVALKTLHSTSGRDVFRFKREFRSLCDLVHPNLATLFELFIVEHEWMFTMELVRGRSFREWARPAGVLRLDRLVPALVQLADGLTALHFSGRVHRDLKPSNVLVEDDGRVVILDFGLVTDVTSDDRTHSHAAVGTPAYMAPEQAADKALTPASDWYAVGTMLYEVLTGRKPYEGRPLELIAAKQRVDPPPVLSLVPDAPPHLAMLCTMMLARDPENRPIGTEVLAALGAHPSPWTLRIADQASPVDVVGRDAELAILREALEASRAGPIAAMIFGPTGSGKTTLLGAFAESLAGTPAIVLAARGDAREDVPYRLFDQVVDGLVSYLLGLDAARRAALIPPGTNVVAKVFPAMRRLVEARAPLLPGELPAAPEALRAKVFEVIQELLRRIAAERPLVLLLDDTQFATELGARAAVQFLQGPRAPHLLMVLAHQSDVAPPAFVEFLAGWHASARVINLSPVPAVPTGGDAGAGS
jgi:hypothetical protein